MLRKDYCFDYLNASFYQYVSLLECCCGDIYAKGLFNDSVESRFRPDLD